MTRTAIELAVQSSDLIAALAAKLPSALATDLVSDFLTIRHDVATGTLGRAAPGKFVESVVQVLQHLETGTHEPKPEVDKYLRGLESRACSLDDGLRICASRVARAMYSLRSKRSIAHKGEIDPNSIDLQFLFAGSQWIMAELLRTVSGASMEEAGDLIARVQTPVGTLVEDFGGKRLAVAGLTAREELLLLLTEGYPDPQTLDALTGFADRMAPKTVSNTLRRLWTDRLVEGSSADGYRLTRAGLLEARRVAVEAVNHQGTVTKRPPIRRSRR